MKDGKPEVLIIGEAHPSSLLSEHPKTYKTKITKALEDIRRSTRILESEIKAIKKFGAKRILFEYIRTDKGDDICAALRKTRNLELFQKALYTEFIKETTLVVGKLGVNNFEIDVKKTLQILKTNIKTLSFIIGSTRVYDVGFFENRVACNKLRFLDYNSLPIDKGEREKIEMKINVERERYMIKNILEQLTDKTVVICGASHIEAIKKDLAKKAYVHLSVICK